MPKAIIVCAVLAQYRVGSLEKQLQSMMQSTKAQYRVGSLENSLQYKDRLINAQYRVGSLEMSGYALVRVQELNTV